MKITKKNLQSGSHFVFVLFTIFHFKFYLYPCFYYFIKILLQKQQNWSLTVKTKEICYFRTLGQSRTKLMRHF